MKIRTGFVSNSSSTSFVITNTTDQPLSLEAFVREIPYLIKDYISEYDPGYPEQKGFTQEQMILDARRRGTVFPPKVDITIAFGDNDGDVLGNVFDYMLRDGGRSRSFKWRFEEFLR